MTEDYACDDNITLNGVDIAYQCHGEIENPTVLMIHGLSSPLSAWPISLVKGIVRQGFHVVLLDNRDMGKSSIIADPKIPNLLWTAIKMKFGFSAKVPYQLEDMMNDALALLDHLNINKVHVVGASMGGMIAQLIAIHHPDRLHTLTSIMSTTGTKRLPPIPEEVNKQLALKPKSKSFDDRLAYHMNKWRVIGSPDFPASEEYLTDYVGGLLERGITAKGTIRQLLAIMTASNRESLLMSVKVPTLVLHGDKDVLVNVEGGKATAQCIPDAHLKIYSGMGHDFPLELVPEMIKDIVQFIHTSDTFTNTDNTLHNKEVSYEPL
jgi:pimeloyl-ACP methyl ester carboxylesterase